MMVMRPLLAAQDTGEQRDGMLTDPLEEWLWDTPMPLPKELLNLQQTAALEDVQQLAALGKTADLQLVDFWQETAVTTDPGNPFRHERLTMAIAALALIAIRHTNSHAIAFLRQLTYHPHPEVRELAIHYLGRSFTETGRPLPIPILNEMSRIAQHDDIFAPRFQARRILQIAHAPIPLDNPGGVYDLKVMPLHNRRIYRTIAIRAEQTLRDLQRFIQHAFEWDNQHLFSFYMNGRKYDGRYRFSCAYEENRPPWAYEAIIGQLGLVMGHHFLYHYDYTADHLFDIEVIAIRAHVPAGNYPRQIDTHGKPPTQFT
ncbi:MAG: plasmid pRiA4b ORF-3 family protein [Anaerolineae bacterium]|nr:plasmid pRiA4b ORF-3 family protein [Anaerolineae bacterium]